MKKIYLFLSLFCLISRAAMAQPTVTLYAAAPPGSYITGSATTTTRTDDNIIVQPSPLTRGYAVFDLSSSGIPAGSTIGSVDCGFDKATVTGTGPTCRVYGYAGDLSLIVSPPTLFSALNSGTMLSTMSWGTAPGNFILNSTAAAATFVQGNLAGQISYCWNVTAGSGVSYTITGETGAAATTGTHAPYLYIAYCPKPTALTAVASPNPVCDGAPLTLTGGATSVGGTLTYSWAGPGLSSTPASSTPYTFNVTPASAGIYTVTAINTCAPGLTAMETFTTTAVTVTPLPAAITGATALCTTISTTTTLSDATAGGTWSSSFPAVASITPSTGVVTAGTMGTTDITYTDGTTGCFVTLPFAVNDVPAAITGPGRVCEGNSITLGESSTGGTWSSDDMTVATVTGGTVLGVLADTTSIRYTVPGCPAAIKSVTVNPQPSAIGGITTVCIGSMNTLSDAIAGGTWSSLNPAVAFFTTPTSNVLHSATLGSTMITYTLPTSCYVTAPATVASVPAPITGPRNVCVGSNIMLSDPSSPGVWSSSSPTIGSIVAPGNVRGQSAGTTVITFTLSGYCNTFHTVTVDPLPGPILGIIPVCQRDSITLSDATAGGEWSSSNLSQAYVGSSTGVVVGVANYAPVNITYTLPTGCYRTASLSVLTAPTVAVTSSGPTTFCSGGSVVLSGTTTPGATYQWSSYTAGDIPGATNSTYMPTVSDTFNLTVTGPNGCVTRSFPTGIYAATLPAITATGDTAFCAGGVAVLSVNASGVTGTVTYQWQKNGVNIPGATSSSYVAAATGIYHALVTITGMSGTCIITTTDKNINAYAQPTPSITYSGNTLNTAASYPAYQWFLNSVSIPGANSRTYVPHTIGSYRVRVSEGHGCFGYSAEYVLNNVGIANINRQDIHIFPNPATGMVHITAASPVRAVITGMEGKVLMNVPDAEHINISSLANGMYLIMLYDEHGEKVSVEKLIKE